ncbi:MAG: molybdate ABC transporter substrate-binding protein [Candidatus Acidiferrales bacterium]
MKPRAAAQAVLLGGILLLLACVIQRQAFAQKQVFLTVSAAISLKDSLDAIGRKYEQSHPGVKIAFNYGGSGTLQHQIEQGAPVDIFFSAAEKQMDRLESEGLLEPGTRRNLLANALVLITPASSSAIADFQDLAKPEVKIIAIGEPATVPAGQYAREVLEHLELWDTVQKKVVYAKDVRAVLAYVETGNADAGLVYRTDAGISSRVRVAATAPDNSHELILYPVAILKGSKNISAARDFLEFLGNPQSREIFSKFGFTMREKQAQSN